jgi:hypothetical protein
LTVDELTTLQHRCSELEGELQAKCLLEAQVSRLEREKVKLVDHLSKQKLDKIATVEYMKGSEVELSTLKLVVEDLHAKLQVAKLTAERESLVAHQLGRQLGKSEEVQRGRLSTLFLFLISLVASF